MSINRKRQRLILGIVATDRTFERRTHNDASFWVGHCIFCSRALTVDDDGSLDARATIEHIVPRAHGGDDQLVNLALACRRCNTEKGVRHDVRKHDDPRSRAIIEALQAKRRARWRDPEEVGLGWVTTV